mgnify:CR=1 FL=1
MNKKRKPLELYVHIPFCIRKCAYCDFVSGPGTKAMQKEYEEALLAEIDAAEETAESEVISVFFGGGTPSAVDAGMLARVMEKLRSKYVFSEDAEITLEANPGTLDAEKLKCYRKSGFNRISIGCQSVHDEELKRLGRIHTFAEFQESFALARDAGFANINVDLMSGLPEQSEEKWEESLRTIAELSPEHISAYSLIVEPGTLFAEQKLDLPDEDTEREMYARTAEILAEYGFFQYEISNYALPESVCRHNLKYWHCEEYLGVGTGAASYMKTNSSGDYCRLKVITDTKAFSEIDWNDPASLDKCFAECDILSLQEQMEEMAFLGLRTKEGVRLSSFYERFGKSFNEVYGEVVKKYTAMGMMKADETHVALTLKGMEVANWIMADFCG